MLVAMSWQGALDRVHLPWGAAVLSVTFLLTFVASALLTWPIWAWAGYWWGRLTLLGIRRLTP